MTKTEARANREALGLDRKQLAERMGMSGKSGHVTVAQWENGDRRMSGMSSEFLKTLVKYESKK